MKVGIIGVGAVGTACAKSVLLRGSCHEIILLDVNESRARGVTADLSHVELLCPPPCAFGPVATRTWLTPVSS
jgi:malate/lactate dehydrogenase